MIDPNDYFKDSDRYERLNKGHPAVRNVLWTDGPWMLYDKHDNHGHNVYVMHDCNEGGDKINTSTVRVGINGTDVYMKRSMDHCPVCKMHMPDDVQGLFQLYSWDVRGKK